MSDDKVLTFNGWTKLDIPPERMGENVPWDSLESVLVLAVTKNGNFIPYASKADLYWCMYMCQRFIHNAMNHHYE